MIWFMADYVAGLISDWQRERPNLDTSPMEVTNRILRTAQLLQARLDEIASDHGLSHKGDLDVLTALRRSGRPFEASPSTLARAVQLTTGGMTLRLDRLERSGLIVRSPDPSDRRGVLVRLTPDGQRLVEGALAKALAEQERILAALTSGDQASIAGILGRLLISLGDEEDRSLRGE